jgi:hypothetical protein
LSADFLRITLIPNPCNPKIPSNTKAIFTFFMLFYLFCHPTKAKPVLNRIYIVEAIVMRKNRKLAKNVWYEVETAVNVGEPLFQLEFAVVLLYRVLRKAKKRFAFEMRGLVLGGAGLAFYIKPADGFQLPRIMQWVKQTFSVRFNMRTGRTGHVWGDRYWSEILPGEPPPGVGEVDWARVEKMANKQISAVIDYALSWVCPRTGLGKAETRFSPEKPPPST